MWHDFFSQKNDKNEEEQKEERSEEDLNVPLSGPDTSSFSAFLVSLLSSEKNPDAERSGSLSDFQTEGKQRKDLGSTSDPRSKERQGRRSLMSYSKRSVRKVIKQVAKIGGYGNQNSELKANSNVETVGHELKPMNSINDAVLKPQLPEISEPSVLLSEDIRSNLYVSLPSLVRERKWILLYRSLKEESRALNIPIWALFCFVMMLIFPPYKLAALGDMEYLFQLCTGGAHFAPVTLFWYCHLVKKYI